MDELRHEGHDYDGIKEYDNPLPSWWLYLFYGSIVFSVWYVGYYTSKGAALARIAEKSQATSWSVAKLDAQMQQAAARQSASGDGREALPLETYITQQENIDAGRKAFEANCVACHGPQGGGTIGPNLVDAYWVHGGEPQDVLNAIVTGFPEKGMPGWGSILGASKVKDITAYVMSLQGSVVPNPKAPEGEKVE